MFPSIRLTERNLMDNQVAVDSNGNVYGSASSGGGFDLNVTHCAGNTPGGCGVEFEVQQ